MSESLNAPVFIVFLRSQGELKPEKSSESHKNHMAKCQAYVRVLESVDQSQEHRMADSKHLHAHKKDLEIPKKFQKRKQANVKCQS